MSRLIDSPSLRRVCIAIVRTVSGADEDSLDVMWDIDTGEIRCSKNSGWKGAPNFKGVAPTKLLYSAHKEILRVLLIPEIKDITLCYPAQVREQLVYRSAEERLKHKGDL